MKFFRLLLFSLLLFGTASLQAQDAYDHAVGLRVGPLSGVTYKRFVTFAGTVEGVLGFNFTNGRTTSLTGLYQQHFFISYQLNAFAGAGITMSFNSTEFRLLGEAMAGLEYSFPRFPMAFSLDYKPAFHIFEGQFFFNEFALTLRYIL